MSEKNLYRIIEANKMQLGRFEKIGNNELGMITGDNFLKIMDKTHLLKDTFGLCGILAIHGAGLLTSKQQWKDISYEPDMLMVHFNILKLMKSKKTASDLWIARFSNLFLDGGTETITEQNPNGFINHAVKTQKNMYEIYNHLSNNQGLIIALICEYEKHQGSHTHWLAAKKINDTTSMLIGDLSPFGIKDCSALRISTKTLVKNMSKVIGASPTTLLTDTVAASAEKDNLMEANRFTVNVIVLNYK